MLQACAYLLGANCVSGSGAQLQTLLESEQFCGGLRQGSRLQIALTRGDLNGFQILCLVSQLPLPGARPSPRMPRCSRLDSIATILPQTVLLLTCPRCGCALLKSVDLFPLSLSDRILQALFERAKCSVTGISSCSTALACRLMCGTRA